MQYALEIGQEKLKRPLLFDFLEDDVDVVELLRSARAFDEYAPQKMTPLH